MGKRAFILKGGACNFTILAAAVKGLTMLCGYHEGVSLFLPYTILCGILLWCCYPVL